MSKKFWDKLQLYIPTHMRETVENFKKICTREGTSASEKIRDWIRDYVDQHTNGNPQLLLRSFTGGPVATKLLPPCAHIGNKTMSKVYCNKAGMFLKFLVCWRCWNRKKGRLK